VLLGIAFLAFVSLGLPDGVLGVAWPSIRATFGVPLDRLGGLLAVAMVGYLVSSFCAGWLVARLGVGALLAWSSVLMVVNSGGYAPYTGLEVTAGQWSYTLLTETRGVTPAMAGAAVAAYWGSLTAGRLLAGALTPRVPPCVLLKAALVLAPVGGVLVWSAGTALLAVVGLMTLGAALAPIYPLLTADTPRRVGSRYATHAIGFQVSAAYLGAAAIPGAVGVAATQRGGDVIGLALVAVALAVLALHEATTRIGRRAGLAALSQVG
jgi:fucose permease